MILDLSDPLGHTTQHTFGNPVSSEIPEIPLVIIESWTHADGMVIVVN